MASLSWSGFGDLLLTWPAAAAGFAGAFAYLVVHIAKMRTKEWFDPLGDSDFRYRSLDDLSKTGDAMLQQHSDAATSVYLSQYPVRDVRTGDHVGYEPFWAAARTSVDGVPIERIGLVRQTSTPGTFKINYDPGAPRLIPPEIEMLLHAALEAERVRDDETFFS